jgi:hypothetical protein
LPVRAHRARRRLAEYAGNYSLAGHTLAIAKWEIDPASPQRETV